MKQANATVVIILLFFVGQGVNVAQPIKSNVKNPRLDGKLFDGASAQIAGIAITFKALTRLETDKTIALAVSMELRNVGREKKIDLAEFKVVDFLGNQYEPILVFTEDAFGRTENKDSFSLLPVARQNCVVVLNLFWGTEKKPALLFYRGQRIGGISWKDLPTESAARGEPIECAPGETIVYLSTSFYHRAGCTVLDKDNLITETLESASGRKAPCPSCNPPRLKKVKESGERP